MACAPSAEIERATRVAICLLIALLGVSCNSRSESSSSLRSVLPAKHGADAAASTGVTVAEAAVLRLARNKPYPKYPSAAFAKNRVGHVVVRIAATADGAVRDVNILESTGEEFTASVREAVQQWQLSPVSVHSRESPPSPVAATLSFYFRIADGTGTVATGSEIAQRGGLVQ